MTLFQNKLINQSSVEEVPRKVRKMNDVLNHEKCELSEWGRRCQAQGQVGIIQRSEATFQPGDWTVLGLTLAISASVGIYWAWKDRNKSSKEYMTGGGNVSPFPIAMSLATTLFSAVTVLGTPVEFYQYGTMFGYFLLTYFICTVLW